MEKLGLRLVQKCFWQNLEFSLPALILQNKLLWIMCVSVSGIAGVISL